MMHEQLNWAGVQNEGASAQQREAILHSVAARKIDLWWPAFAAIALTPWTAARSTDRDAWWNLAWMCGPPAALYAAVENARQKRALSDKRRKPLMLTSPLVLLAVTAVWWIALMVLTRANAVYLVLEMGPC